MMTNYEKGRNFEYRIATFFRRRGYFVLRSAGSHGPADLVAVKKGRPTLLIQCKKGMGSVDVEEHNKLYRTALESGSLPVIASSADRRPTIFRQITGIAQKTGDAEKVVKGSMF